MHDILLIAQALSDETRLRAVLLLRHEELCVCELIHVLGLAPSTISRHLSILHTAGLVARRKEGKWHYYRLRDRDASPAARAALRWVLTALADGPDSQRDTAAACGVREKARDEVTSCYR